MNRQRATLIGVAIALVAFAALMPQAWYWQLPRDPALPLPPLSGVHVLQGMLALQAALLMTAAVGRWTYVGRPGALPLADLNDWTEADDIGAGTARGLLAAITVGALLLRVYHLGSDLWLDEITPIQDYGPLPVAQVLGSYMRSNNHLLNTLLIKLMMAVFGEQEWAVRVPAMLFGVAGIPLTYWCARLVLSRRAALGASLLLAVSYHHILFSQNARGYTAYLAFALLGTRLLVNALRDDRARSWIWYVLASVLGIASLLNTSFVLAAHGIVALGVFWRIRREPAAPALLRRIVAIFATIAFLCVELYAVALPDVYVVITHVYKTQSTGFVLLSGEFLQEVLRGITAGFGTGALIAAIPFALVALAGYVALWRRSWAIAALLALPGVLTATFLVVRGLTASPRFFLLWLPLAIITAVVSIDAMVGAWSSRSTAARRALTVGPILLLAVLSGASLLRYYSTPKQPYRAAIAYAEAHRAPDDMVMVVYLAEVGVQYYANRTGTPTTQHYRFVRTIPAFDSTMAAAGTNKVWLITTFERAQRMDLPEIDERIHRGWREVTRFPAQIGDGSIAVWAPQPQQ